MGTLVERFLLLMVGGWVGRYGCCRTPIHENTRLMPLISVSFLSTYGDLKNDSCDSVWYGMMS